MIGLNLYVNNWNLQLNATPEGGIFSGNVAENGVFTPETAPMGWNVITYTYEDENTCVNWGTDSIYVDKCVGINNNDVEVIVNIYPNPNNASFKILSAIKIKSAEIINYQGKILFSVNPDNKEVNINTKVQKGTYILKLRLNNNSVINSKIIIND